MAVDVTCGAWRPHAFNGSSLGQSGLVDPETGARLTSVGCRFQQLPDVYPALAPLYTSFELDFDALPFVRFAADYWWAPWAISAAYLLAIPLGLRIMKAVGPVKPKKLMAAWNLLLSTFSAVGFVRTAPHLLNFIATHGLYPSICSPAEVAYGQGAAGLWTMLFIFSKVPELVDTVFIVLAGRPPIFLHWYHHFTVLLYCWHSYATRSSAGIYFAVMNYGVHSVMYFYYFLTALGYRPTWDFIVTTLQISQMFVGIGICCAVAWFRRNAIACDITDSNYAAGLIMYGSYALLFVLFAVERYFAPPKDKTRKAEAKKQA